jgi:hypothetical protein
MSWMDHNWWEAHAVSEVCLTEWMRMVQFHYSIPVASLVHLNLTQNSCTYTAFLQKTYTEVILQNMTWNAPKTSCILSYWNHSYCFEREFRSGSILVTFLRRHDTSSYRYSHPRIGGFTAFIWVLKNEDKWHDLGWDLLRFLPLFNSIPHSMLCQWWNTM